MSKNYIDCGLFLCFEGLHNLEIQGKGFQEQNEKVRAGIIGHILEILF